MLDDSDNLMKPIDSGAALAQQVASFRRWPSSLQALAKAALRKLITEDRINRFLEQNRHCRNFDFIDAVFDELAVDCDIRHGELRNIPARGRVVIVANHPLGGLDGLALLRLVGSIRRDVRVVANELLLNIDPLKGVFLPVDVFGNCTSKAHLGRIIDALANDEAVIIFPAGEVSRAGVDGIRDRKWLSGFIRIAEKTAAPVVPIHIKARNSVLFYLTAKLSASLSMLMLPREMTQFTGKIALTIGAPIEAKTLQALPLRRAEKAQLVARHLRRIGTGKPPILESCKPVIQPVDRQSLRAHLQHAERLGTTADNMHILLVDFADNKPVMDEIGRLRELTFRAVGEGTGQHKDLDIYDRYYRHLVLWDDAALEIAGAYRLGEVWRWPDRAPAKLYTHSLFEFSPNIMPFLAQGLELGRSFVQPHYWGRRSLDYLWQGIGAYLAVNPDVRYLFGPVSLSNRLSRSARDHLVHFYSTHFRDKQALVRPRMAHVIEPASVDPLRQIMPGQDFDAEQAVLKERLAFMGVKIPTLYKQYADVCLFGGVRFCGFNIDPHFNHCTDGFVMVDTALLKPKKRARYIKTGQ
jgi:putative hemolysin